MTFLGYIPEQVQSSKPSYLPSFGNKKDVGYAASSSHGPDDGGTAATKQKEEVAARRLPHPSAEWSAQKFKKAAEMERGTVFRKKVYVMLNKR
jgi:hypothetical protein